MTMPPIHINQIELADRWKISPRTLERWRWAGQGPAFVKLGGRVVYSLEAIEAYGDVPSTSPMPWISQSRSTFSTRATSASRSMLGRAERPRRMS